MEQKQRKRCWIHLPESVVLHSLNVVDLCLVQSGSIGMHILLFSLFWYILSIRMVKVFVIVLHISSQSFFSCECWGVCCYIILINKCPSWGMIACGHLLNWYCLLLYFWRSLAFCIWWTWSFLTGEIPVDKFSFDYEILIHVNA